MLLNICLYLKNNILKNLFALKHHKIQKSFAAYRANCYDIVGVIYDL